MLRYKRIARAYLTFLELYFHEPEFVNKNNPVQSGVNSTITTATVINQVIRTFDQYMR